MSDKSICRIGVFYDGSYFAHAQGHFYHARKLGWLDFRAFHSLLESYVRSKEQGFTSYKVVYGGWFQGMFPVGKATETQLKFDRRRYHDLMHAGIEPKYLPTSGADKEKGSDVALAIDAMQTAADDKIDIAVLVTGDGDMVPLARAIMKTGVRVLAAYFDYKDEKDRSFINERLLAACNYEMNVNRLETDKDFKTLFKSLFRKPEAKPAAKQRTVREEGTR
jgi:uncharacterized LabA/DUF88 family protein